MFQLNWDNIKDLQAGAYKAKLQEGKAYAERVKEGVDGFPHSHAAGKWEPMDELDYPAKETADQANEIKQDEDELLF